MDPVFRRRLVWLVPALFSLGCSLSSVGTHVFWQDSGFYLTAVHEMSVLYPHGFVAYQLLCKLWTLVFSFLDFTLAVHLFSSACAALAAAILALAARDFLRTREGAASDVAGMLTGCLSACGYTFWMAGIYAKGYALLYLVLALLQWALVRAGSDPKPADVLRVALLWGTAWAVHPSAALGAIALGWFFWRAARMLGWKAVAPRLAAGAAAAFGPALLLPLLAMRDRETSMGDPRGAAEIAEYLVGSRFTAIPGVFGFDSGRLLHLIRFLWEEYLGIGLALVGLGMFLLARTHRRLLLAGAAWTVPITLVALLFKIEGQSDHWYVAAFLPLALATAAGLQALAERGGPVLVGAAAVAAVAWAAIANGNDLGQRSYDLAETYARIHLQNLEPRAILITQTDDIVATCWYLQRIRGERQDVLVVNASHLGSGSWYEDRLRRHHPELRFPQDGPGQESADRIAAFATANARGERPLYTVSSIPADHLPAGYVLSPRGPVLKLVPSAEDRLDPAWWQFPLEAEQVPPLFRRARGLAATLAEGVLSVEHEPYERRLLKALLKARHLLADWHFRRGGTEIAARLYESILALDPDFHRNERMIHSLGLCYLALGRDDKAEIVLQKSAEIAVNPWTKASSWLGLGDLRRRRGDPVRARACYQEAARVSGLTSEQRREVDRRLNE
jgi:tetratricopeptide (TPR) repeat protein